jgi:hypothetical protein
VVNFFVYFWNTFSWYLYWTKQQCECATVPPLAVDPLAAFEPPIKRGSCVSKLAISVTTGCSVTACGRRGWRSVPAIGCTSERAGKSSCCYSWGVTSDRKAKDIERAKTHWTNYLKENKHGKAK